MAIVFTCGSVSIVSNKQSIYTRVILIVRGSPQRRAGRYTLYASPRQCRGQCDGQPQPASLAAGGWWGWAGRWQAVTSQHQPPVGPQHPTSPHHHQWHSGTSGQWQWGATMGHSPHISLYWGCFCDLNKVPFNKAVDRKCVSANK